MTKTVLIINSGTPTPFNNTIKFLIKNDFRITQFIPSNENKIENKNGMKLYYVKIPFNYKINIPILRFINNQLKFILMSIILFTKSFIYLIHNLHDINILYGNRPLGAIICHFLGRIFNKPNVSRFYGIVFSYLYVKKSFFNLKRINFWQTYLAFKLSADLYIITNDGTFGDKLASHFKIPKNKYRYYYNGINKCVPQAKKEKRDKVAILTLSRLHILKRIDRLINAVPKVVSRCKNVEFVIVGSGEEKNHLMKLAEKLNVSEYINFKEKVPYADVYSIMQSADIYCAVSDYSNVTNPVFESMVVGLPAILTNSGSTGELINNYDNGIIIDEEEVAEKLPLKIIELIEDKKLRKKIGNNAKKFIMNNFLTWEERIQLEVNDINEILESK